MLRIYKNKIYKNLEVLEVRKSDLQDINTIMSVYSENGDLYDEYKIEEDTTHYVFPVFFDNGYNCVINICTGQCNGYIDIEWSNPNNQYVTSICLDEGFKDEDIYILNFYIEGQEFAIKIKEN